MNKVCYYSNGGGGENMHKKLFSLILSALMFGQYQVFSYNDVIDIKVNGEYIYTDSEIVIENGVSLAPIRWVSNALGAKSVNWYPGYKTAGIDMGNKNIFIDINNDIAYINSIPHTFNADSRIINDRTYIPVRLVSELLGAKVHWDSYYKNIEINVIGHKTPEFSIDTTYNDDDLLWLGRIIHAESTGEPIKGKIAVGNVILNRVKSPLFPNTIYGVIFDRTHGIQFEPTINGAIYNIPDKDSIKAAKHALSGTDVAGKCLYFFNPKTAQSNWISKNREFYTTIANHDFYL